MQDSFSARPWDEVRRELDAAGVPYVVTTTCASRQFFPVDKVHPYVLRVRREGEGYAVTLAALPLRSAAVAAYEEYLL